MELWGDVVMIYKSLQSFNFFPYQGKVARPTGTGGLCASEDGRVAS